MIPRDILKKIRQIELRAKRIVQGLLPIFQLLRISARMEDRHNYNAVLFNEKVDHKWKTSDYRAPNFASNFRKPFRVLNDLLKVIFDYGAKFSTEAFALPFVKRNGIVELLFCNAAKNAAAFHLRYFASNFAFTSDKGTTSSGSSKWSFRRWSMRSASPGVNSFDSTMSFQRLRHSSICSASGKARASSKTVFELIAVIYRVASLMQVGFWARCHTRPATRFP